MAENPSPLTRETLVPEPQVTRLTRFLVLTTALLMAWPLWFGLSTPRVAQDNREVDAFVSAYWQAQDELLRAQTELARLRLQMQMDKPLPHPCAVPHGEVGDFPSELADPYGEAEDIPSEHGAVPEWLE